MSLCVAESRDREPADHRGIVRYLLGTALRAGVSGGHGN
jgi:hypothetical protein